MSIGVNRIEGITFAMIAPNASGTLFAGQGAVARLDGSADPFVAASRTQFLDLGSSATAGVGYSRAAQFMLLQQTLSSTIVLKGQELLQFMFLQQTLSSTMY